MTKCYQAWVILVDYIYVVKKYFCLPIKITVLPSDTPTRISMGLCPPPPLIAEGFTFKNVKYGLIHLTLNLNTINQIITMRYIAFNT